MSKEFVHTGVDTQVSTVQNLRFLRHMPILDSGQLLWRWSCGSTIGSCQRSFPGDPTRSCEFSVSSSRFDLILSIRHQESCSTLFIGISCGRSVQSLLGSASSELWSSSGELRVVSHVQFLLYMGSECGVISKPLRSKDVWSLVFRKHGMCGSYDNRGHLLSS